MKNHKFKKLVATAILASVIATTGGSFAGRNSLEVYAAEMTGTVTVTASSLWTYSKADWNMRTQVVNRGATFNITEKLTVAGREMYGLTSGLYITANTAYVKAEEVLPVEKLYKTNTENLNMRTGNSTLYGIILTIPKGSRLEVISTLNGWDQVIYNGNTGWVSGKYLASSSAPAPTVTFKNTTHNLNMRTGATTGHAVILTIPQGSRVEVLSSAGGWDQVSYNGKTGFASSQYLVEAENVVTGEDIVSYAKTFLGVPYTWGGNSPEEGFDCSGLIKYVYGNFGIVTPRVSGSQATFGTAVPMNALQPGDVLYFGNGSVSHTAIYVGGNEMLHAPQPGKTVEIRDMSWHVNNYGIVGARRFLK